MKIMIRRGENGLSIYVPKKDLEEPIVESEFETLWGGWIKIANGWVLELPEMAADTRLPITVEAKKRGRGGSMNAPILDQDFLNPADAESLLADLAKQLRAGQIIPYLGPGLAELSKPSIPMTPEDLAAFFATKVALPRRAKGNAWAAAQHIESFKHRATVTKLMNEAFAAPVEPTPLLRHLATLPLPLIVDTWYDGAARAALPGRGDWGEVQGISRAGIGEDRWYRFYDAAGGESTRAAAEDWKTVLYKPHGGVDAGEEFPDFRRRLCRGPDRDRHPDADPRRGQESPHRSPLPVHRLPLPRPDAAHLRAAGHQAFGDAALRPGRSGEADAERAPFLRDGEDRADRRAAGARL